MNPASNKALALGETQPTEDINEWLQPVILVNNTPTLQGNLTVSGGEGDNLEFKYLDEFTMHSCCGEPKVSLDNNELIFAGYVAPLSSFFSLFLFFYFILV